MTDILVGGGGPGGLAAALMARSLKIDVLLVEPRTIGGRLPEIPDIENLPGVMSGLPYAEAMQRQIADSGLTIVAASIDSVDVVAEHPTARLSDGRLLSCSHLVWAAGLRPRTPSESDWVVVDPVLPTSNLSPAEAITARDVDVMVIIGGDRPLGSFLRSSRADLLPVVHIFYRPDERYKLAELAGGPWRLEHHEVDRVTVLPGPGDRSAVTAVKTDGRTLSFKNSVVRMNLGYVPNNGPIAAAVTLADDGYPTSRPQCVSIVGDAAHEHSQRISIALGEGAQAVLAWYYRREGLPYAGPRDVGGLISG
jgi:thioredoxin reductase